MFIELLEEISETPGKLILGISQPPYDERLAKPTYFHCNAEGPLVTLPQFRNNMIELQSALPLFIFLFSYDET